MLIRNLILLLSLPLLLIAEQVKPGIDRFFEEEYSNIVRKKKVGLITNHTGVDSNLRSTLSLFKEKCQLVAVFTPEHGFFGSERAAHEVKDTKVDTLKIHSLHGKTRRPTEEMLQDIDILVYDIQEIGCRSYTYASTLFYVMEEAAKKNIPVIVLDRPNPLGGIIVDGPMLHEKWRSFLGYINVPYCHGMTIGELARFFNSEYNIHCTLNVVPMKGWKRTMIYADTGLPWIPTSPYIPESDTPFFYASTGILGSLNVVNIGIGYTLPFKVVGAPWIDAEDFAAKLNAQRLPGVTFIPFHYRPFYGKFKDMECRGVKIMITAPNLYRPLAVQYMLIGILKSLYPLQFRLSIEKITPAEESSFCKVNGNEDMLKIIQQRKYVAWELIRFEEDLRKAFLEKRKTYLMYE